MIHAIASTENNFYYYNKALYMIGISKIIFSIINQVYEDKKYNFSFYCNINEYQSGSPIFLGRNSKLIGLFNGYCYKKHSFGKNCSIATFLYYPIKEFIQINNK